MSFLYLGCLNIIRAIARRILYFASFAFNVIERAKRNYSKNSSRCIYNAFITIFLENTPRVCETRGIPADDFLNFAFSR